MGYFGSKAKSGLCRLLSGLSLVTDLLSGCYSRGRDVTISEPDQLIAECPDLADKVGVGALGALLLPGLDPRLDMLLPPGDHQVDQTGSSRAVTATAAYLRARRARCYAPTEDWHHRTPTAAMHSACPTGLATRPGSTLPPLIRVPGATPATSGSAGRNMAS